MKSIQESLQEFYQSPATQDVDEGILDGIKKAVSWVVKKISGWPIFTYKDDNGDDVAAPVATPLFCAKAIGDGLAGDCAHFIPASPLGAIANLFGIKTATAEQVLADFARTKKSIFESIDLNNPESFANICEAFSLSGNNQYGPDVDTKTLKARLKLGAKNPSLPPFMIWGAPGIGKTAIVSAVLDEFAGKKVLITKNLSEMTADEFTLPNVVKDETGATKEMEDVPKSWLPVYKLSGDPEIDAKNDNLANQDPRTAKDPNVIGEGGILFFDEIARCKASVQGVALTLIQDRVIAGGKYKLGSKWTIVAASNRECDENSRVQDEMRFSTALGNRFEQVNFVPDIKDWFKWAETKDYMSKDVLAFLKFNEKYWYNMNPEDEEEHVFASPRSWENCCKTLYAIYNDPDAKDYPIETLDAVASAAIKGTVGDKAATEFMTFKKLADSVDIEGLKKVYDNPKAAPAITKNIRTDLKYYMVSMAISAADPKKLITPQQFENICTWLGESKDESIAADGLHMILNLFPEIQYMIAPVDRNGNPMKLGKYKNDWDKYVGGLNAIIKLIPSIEDEIKVNL